MGTSSSGSNCGGGGRILVVVVGAVVVVAIAVVVVARATNVFRYIRDWLLVVVVARSVALATFWIGW